MKLNMTPRIIADVSVHEVLRKTAIVVNDLSDKAENIDIVSVKDFGAVGNGVTDDTIALTNFFNSAISRPGVEHRLEAKTYAVSAVMPTINVSNVIIRGDGAEIHDLAPDITGTVLKWIGASGTNGPLVKISSVSGAANQRVSHVVFSGIGINCGVGNIKYGIELSSIWNSVIDVAILDAGLVGMIMNVVATLGEAKDTQRNIVRLKARQYLVPAGMCLTAGGDYDANVSLNEFWIECQHTDVTAIYLTNSDNNDWRFVRLFKMPSGTATESMSILGGANERERSRAERFHYVAWTVPAHVYGTATYTYPSINHSIYNLDTENGSAMPIVDAGGSVHVHKDSSGLSDDPWVSYTPTLSVTSGSLTTASATGYYARRGKILHYKVQIVITTNGTGAGALGFTVPVVAAETDGQNAYGKERAINGKAVMGFLDGGTSICYIQNYDGTYPGINGAVINVGGFYEVA
jgi:hypothetical protein